MLMETEYKTVFSTEIQVIPFSNKIKAFTTADLSWEHEMKHISIYVLIASIRFQSSQLLLLITGKKIFWILIFLTLFKNLIHRFKNI